MTLLDLQRDMRAWLRSDSDTPVRRLGGASAAPGLRVYRNNHRASLIACLDESFARTRDWIGGAAFADAIDAHIARVPPSSWTLDAYPRDFPATLGGLYPNDPEVAELAWIEYALGEAFVAANAPTLAANELADRDWDRAILHFTPSLDLAEAHTNAAAIWSALGAGEMPPAAQILPEPGATLVWRAHDVSHFRTLDAQEFQAVLMARAGLSFARLCTALVDTLGQDEGVACTGKYLGRWLADGLLSRITTEN